MENHESRTELVEQQTGQRPQELGDQQRIDQKARALTMEQDRNSTSGTSEPEVSRIEPQLGRDTRTEHVLNGDEAAIVCESIAHKKNWIEQNPHAPASQLEKMRKDIADGEAQIKMTPIGNCPTE
jgi:hypothetical protein